jgi:hypothetical protein
VVGVTASLDEIGDLPRLKFSMRSKYFTHKALSTIIEHVLLGRCFLSNSVSESGGIYVVSLQAFDVDDRANTEMGKEIQLVCCGRDLIGDPESTNVF